jgi:hypothetical protein
MHVTLQSNSTSRTMTGAAAALRRSAPHIIMRRFLGETLAGRLMGFATANEDRFVPSGLGTPAD